MQPDLIRMNKAKEIDPNALRQSLQFWGRNFPSGKHYADEHSRVIAPVTTETIVDLFYERIVRIPHL
jgi:hypothetical protein